MAELWSRKVNPYRWEHSNYTISFVSHLLDLLKNYVIYETHGNKKIKKLANWHTQDSGKSLSMLWLATQLMFRFGNPPIVLVTDRKQLDEQIHGIFKACGFPDPISAKSRRHLQELLSNPRGKTVMPTIQKFGSKASSKLGHPHPASNLLFDEKSGALHLRQTNVPSS